MRKAIPIQAIAVLGASLVGGCVVVPADGRHGAVIVAPAPPPYYYGEGGEGGEGGHKKPKVIYPTGWYYD